MNLTIEFDVNPISGETVIYAHADGKQSVIVANPDAVNALIQLREFVEKSTP